MENWKPIPDYPEYAVSDQGRVFSWKTGKYLVPNPRHQGYFQVQLYKNNKRHVRKIHQLVLETFRGRRPQNKTPGPGERHTLQKNRPEPSKKWVTCH